MVNSTAPETSSTAPVTSEPALGPAAAPSAASSSQSSENAKPSVEASSIITQVQQPQSYNNDDGDDDSLHCLDDYNVGDDYADYPITLEIRGIQFNLTRREFFRLPDFMMLSLFPDGNVPMPDRSGVPHIVDSEPQCVEYMLDTFNSILYSQHQSQQDPASSGQSSRTSSIHDVETKNQASRDQSSDSQHELSPSPTGSSPLTSQQPLNSCIGLVVLREDMDYFTMPPHRDITHEAMIELRRAVGRVLLKRDEIFVGLKKNADPMSTEKPLVDMLTLGGFGQNARWGRRIPELRKASIVSLGHARLRSDSEDENVATAVHKLMLFWHKPARRCWWKDLEIDDIEGVKGKVKVWVRRIWTLETVVLE